MDEPNTPPPDEWYGPRPANHHPPIFAAVAAELDVTDADIIGDLLAGGLIEPNDTMTVVELAPVAIDQAVPDIVYWDDHHGKLPHGRVGGEL